MDRKKNRTSLILFLAFLAAGAVTLFFGVQATRNGFESRGWPDTPGKIQSNSISTQTRRSSSGSSKTSYVARITYGYQVNGRGYIGSTVGFGKSQYSSYTRSKTQKYLQQYPRGKSVTVYYDPQNPGKAVLQAGVTAGALLIVAMGVIFVFAAIALGVSALKNRSRIEAN